MKTNTFENKLIKSGKACAFKVFRLFFKKIQIFMALVLLIIFMALGSTSVFGQVMLENNSFTTIPDGTTATSISIPNYDPGTADNRVMLVAVTTSRRQVYSATFAGSPLTALGTVNNGNSYVRFFYMVNPPSGSASLSASLESDDRGFVMGVATFSGVDTDDPLNTFTFATNNIANPTIIDIPTSPGSMVFSAVSYRNSGHVYTGVGTDQVERWNFANNGSNDRHRSVGSDKPIPSGTTTSMSYSIADGTNWSAGAVSLNPFIEPELSISKTASSPDNPVTVGSSITYTIEVENLTTGPISNIEVEDILSANLDFVSSTASQSSYNGGTGLWNVGTINGGQTATLTIETTAENSGIIYNTAEITNSSVADPLFVENIDTAHLIVVKPALDEEIYGFRGDGNDDFWRYDIDADAWLLTAANASDPLAQAPVDNVKEGGALTTDGNYIYGLQGAGTSTFWRYDVITNTWSTMAPAPATVNVGGALVYLNGNIYAFRGNTTDNFWRYDIGTNTWSTMTAAPAVVGAGGALSTDGTFIYGLGGNQTTGFWRYDPGNNTWNTSLTPPATTVDKGGSLVYSNGYLYAFSGNGDVFFRYEILTDSWETLPVTPNNIAEGGALTVVGDMIYALRGNSNSFWSYDLTSAPGGSWSLLAVTPENVKWGGALTTFRVLKADLEVTKEVSAPAGSAFNPGESLTYTITVENLGSDPANEVEVVDQLPSEVTYVSDNSGGAYDTATGIWDVGVLNASATETLEITATVKSAELTAGRTVTNTALVSAITADDVSANNTDDASFQVNGADLAITKIGTSPDNPVVEGSSITYTITITNNGPNTANGIEVTDILPPSLSYVSSSATQSSYNDATGLWNVGSLVNGASATLTINTTVLSGGSIRNTASITNSSEDDSFQENNSDKSVISALKSFSEGACIIDLGITSSYNAGLKPYGLVFDLVKNNSIPVFWAINPEKSFVSETAKVDQIDFSVNGFDYRSGAFIISSEFASLPTVQTVINSWVSANPGLTVRCNQPAFDAPVHGRITSMPRAALDTQNGKLAEDAFFNNNRAGIQQFYIENDPDASPYYKKTPLQLNACDDVYIMPHADPHGWTQATKNSFETFIENGGWLFAACHAVGSLEGLYEWNDNGSPRTGYNLLSNEGLVEWGDHGNGTPPYSYRVGSGQYYVNIASDPFMQYIGTTDGALQNGSEQIFVPLVAGWRSTTTIAVWDPDQPDAPSPGTYPDYVSAAVAYGRAFGDPTLGMILYQGSHTFAGGNIQQNIGAARVLGNWWFQAGIEQRPEILPTIAVPGTVYSGQSIEFGIDVFFNVPGSTLESVMWTSTCGGSFDDPTSLTPVYTLPIVTEPTQCIITVEIEDNCGRRNIESWPLIIEGSEIVANDDFYGPVNGVTGDPNIGNAFDNDTLNSDPVDADDITATVTSPATPVNPGDPVPVINPQTGIVSVPAGTPPGVYTIEYQICENINLTNCDNATVTVIVGPNAVDDLYATPINTAMSDDVSTNDAYPSGSTFTDLSSPSNGTLAFNPDGTFTYTPNTGFSGVDQFDYKVCFEYDNVEYCSEATVTIIVGPNAEDDLYVTLLNTAVSGDVSTNDNYPAGSTFNDLTAPANGTLMFNTDGTFTYTPNTGFFGNDVFTYNVCFNEGGVDYCDEATVTIFIQNPDIQIIKTNTNNPQQYSYVDDLLTYDLAVTNTGNVVLTNVVVSDPSATVIGTQGFTLNPGQSVVMQAEYIVTQADLEAGSFTNIATATGTYTDINGNPQTVTDSDTETVNAAPPDVTPIITAIPNVMQGKTEFNLTVRVTELNNIDTRGLITVKIPKDVRLSFKEPYNSGRTMLGNIPVNNSDWSFSEDAINYIFTTTTVIPAGGFSAFGFVAEFDPGQTKGVYTLTSQIESGSGGEIRINNNVDSEKLDYFIQ